MATVEVAVVGALIAIWLSVPAAVTGWNVIDHVRRSSIHGGEFDWEGCAFNVGLAALWPLWLALLPGTLLWILFSELRDRRAR